ncbi:hypothetical protein [Haloarchaeobius sp. TZWWS8]|uniref:hypothetical protein n=1 Tax=Haloarchaeobius sp. TZWWS8 TaxID=3446121 RepID=UPI003EBB790E
MGEKSDFRDRMVRNGLLAAVLIGYGALVLGGFVAVFFATAWLDTNVLQPMVGGSDLLTLVLFGGVMCSFVWVVFRLGGSESTGGSGPGAPSSIFMMGSLGDDDDTGGR